MTGEPMHAQVLHEWGGEVRYETVARPSVVAGEVLIEVEACSVGLTVLNYMSGNHSRRPEDLPRIPGHEIVGRVIATGDGVSSPRVGERRSEEHTSELQSRLHLVCRLLLEKKKKKKIKKKWYTPTQLTRR